MVVKYQSKELNGNTVLDVGMKSVVMLYDNKPFSVIKDFIDSNNLGYSTKHKVLSFIRIFSPKGKDFSKYILENTTC